MNRSSYRYVPREETTDAGFQRTVALSREHPYWGYRKIHALLRREGVSISRERVRLIRRREGLQVPRKRRKRRRLGMTTQWVHRAMYPNHVWSYDLMYDQTEDGRPLKILTVVADYQHVDVRIGQSPQREREMPTPASGGLRLTRCRDRPTYRCRAAEGSRRLCASAAGRRRYRRPAMLRSPPG